MIRKILAFLCVLTFAGSAVAQDRATGYKPPTPEKRHAAYMESIKRHGSRLKMMAQNQELPAAFDCRDKGWVLPVGDQGNCVLPGSKILMADGSERRIQDVRIGDEVSDADGNPVRVNFVVSREVDERIVRVIATGDHASAFTSDHPLYSGSVRIPAGALRVGDRVSVRSKHGETLAKVLSVERENYKGKVYNLIISRSETYVVDGFCVHNCGSCYLYSTIYDTVGSAFIKAGYGKNDLTLLMSVQYGMDRPRDFGGCGGGWGAEVAEWVLKNGWIAESWIDTDGKVHHDYPSYEARERQDRTAAGAKRWQIGSFGFVSASPNRPATMTEVETGIANFGVLNTAIAAGGQFGSGSGDITALGTNIDHEISIVAYDRNRSNSDGTKGALLLRNQWTKAWGNQGYRWVTYKAAARLVDIFFVTAAALPPPPPPDPDPVPVPVPIGGVGEIIIRIKGQPDIIYELSLPGEKARRDKLDAAILEYFKMDPKSPAPTPEVKKPEPPMKLPEGPKDEPKKPEVEPKAKPKVIDGDEAMLRRQVSDLQVKVAEKSRDVRVSVSHEFDQRVATVADLRREHEWLERRLEAMSRP